MWLTQLEKERERRQYVYTWMQGGKESQDFRGCYEEGERVGVTDREGMRV